MLTGAAPLGWEVPSTPCCCCCCCCWGVLLPLLSPALSPSALRSLVVDTVSPPPLREFRWFMDVSMVTCLGLLDASLPESGDWPLPPPPPFFCCDVPVAEAFGWVGTDAVDRVWMEAAWMASLLGAAFGRGGGCILSPSLTAADEAAAAPPSPPFPSAHSAWAVRATKWVTLESVLRG